MTQMGVHKKVSLLRMYYNKYDSDSASNLSFVLRLRCLQLIAQNNIGYNNNFIAFFQAIGFDERIELDQ